MTPPPLSERLLYRLVGWRLGPAHREWVYADLKSRRWVVRQLRLLLPVFVGAMTLVFVATGSSPARLAFPAFALVVLYTGLRNALMTRALKQQGLTLDGQPDPKATWYDDDEARRRQNVSGTLTLGLLFVGGLVYLALTRD